MLFLSICNSCWCWICKTCSCWSQLRLHFLVFSLLTYCCSLSSVLLLSLELNNTKSLLMVSSHNWIFGNDYILCNYPVCGKYTFFSCLTSALVTSLKFIQVWLCLLVFFSLSWFTFIVQKISGFAFCLKFCFMWQTCSAQELEKDLHGPAADSLPVEKRLAIFDKIFTTYHKAGSCIRSDLVWKVTS